jgi:pimeloyl-ACP methyl ester carboxylesterase
MTTPALSGDPKMSEHAVSNPPSESLATRAGWRDVLARAAAFAHVSRSRLVSGVTGARLRPHHGLRALTALCLATTFLAAPASIGAAAAFQPATDRTTTAKSAERTLGHPVTRKNEACPAPFGPTEHCRTATPKSAERMLRSHRITLRTEACPAPFDITTTCGVATVPANWAKRHGRRTLEIWYAWVPAPSGASTGVTVPFMGGPGEAISAVAERFLALVPALPDRDMLLVDVRGTGRSGRLGCPTLDTAQWISAGQEQVDAVARCAQEVGSRRDDYTTVGSVLDVEAIRRALNLPNPSLLGVSYGTWVVQTYAALFPDLVQAAVIDGIVPFDLDPWGRTYTDAMQRVLRLRCERTTLCDPAEADAQVRRVAASLAARPVPFPNSTRLLTEGAFSAVSIFAIQYTFADYLTAIDRALEGDYGPLLALTEAISEPPPPNPIGDSRAIGVVVACNEYSAPFDLDHKLPKREAEFERGLAELPDDAFGWFSKQGWVGSAWEQVDFCLEYPRPRFSLELRPPYLGPFPNVPVLMLNGDIDLQTPLESAERARKNWPNSVFLTIKDATHVTVSTNECALGTALSFLQNPVLPDARVCDSEN